MRWGPRLVIRFCEHGVASPTSAVGHLFAIVFVGVMVVGATASLLASRSDVRWVPLVLVLAWLLLFGQVVRDAWAWLAAPEAERAVLRAEVESLRPWTPPRGYVPIFDAHRWRRAVGALLAAALGASFAFARWNEGLLVPAMFAIAFFAAGGRDLARAGHAPGRPPAG
ncbi:MAG TPA: hypothetical protein VFL83_03790 [Anaeromyxobacter sp.]|nr:hypothetical protein [Anaeromyxobacter sp.]